MFGVWTNNALNDLRDLAVIEFVFDLAGGLTPSSFPFLGTIIESEQAVRELNARVGREVPEAASIISEVYTGAWGESREEVAKNAAAVLQIGVAAD